MGTSQSSHKKFNFANGIDENERYYGFENFGNTCYCNSVLQALYFCKPFRNEMIKWIDIQKDIETNGGENTLRNDQKTPGIFNSFTNFFKDEESDDDENSMALIYSLANLFRELSEKKKKTGFMRPKEFIATLKKQNVMFRSYNQQDAHEFLMYILNYISESFENMNKSEKKESKPTLIQEIFQGLQTTETKCMTCENTTSREEPFLDLSIDIERNSSISHCLKKLSKIELLSQSDKFLCEQCCSLQEAQRRTRIKKTPKILIVHLKRFKFLEKNQKYVKLSHRVTFPLEIRIDPSEELFELIAIVVHLGSNVNSGHYVSCIRSKETWMLFDDDRVEPIDQDTVLNCCFGKVYDSHYSESGPLGNSTGYILFYEKKEENNILRSR